MTCPVTNTGRVAGLMVDTPPARDAGGITRGGRVVTHKLVARIGAAAFALAVLVSLVGTPIASATPSIPIPPPVAEPRLGR
jgi:hypothetical protein